MSRSVASDGARLAQKKLPYSVERKRAWVDAADSVPSVSQQCESNTLDVEFCLEPLEKALRRGCPEVSDQGVQFTSPSFTGRLETAGAKVSMDGKGQWQDNVFVGSCGEP